MFHVLCFAIPNEILTILICKCTKTKENHIKNGVKFKVAFAQLNSFQIFI